MKISYEYEDLTFTVKFSYLPPRQSSIYSPPEAAEIEIEEIGLCGPNHRFIQLSDEAQSEIMRSIGWQLEEACWEELQLQGAAQSRPQFSNLISASGWLR